ncbi:ATP-binding protein [Frankia sp. EI5c]|uniref:ATP-binding protein n=1 Tax=Frankia sp. EI5c TaxID=683316 RepID=UPI001F5BBD6D|nr:ATP-binding protein [Frankia sp. EI5c]
MRTLVLPAGGILLVAGIPGAGKSTLIHRLFQAALPVPAQPAARPRSRAAAGSRSGPRAVRRVPPEAGPMVLDSAQVRDVLARRLHLLPYSLYRPLVHTVHYARIAVWAAGPRRDLVIHECGTRGWARRTVALLARIRRRPAYLVFLETPPDTALAGQHQRGRIVPSRSFRRHERSWERLRDSLRDGSLVDEGWTWARAITRDEAALLTEVRFE